MSDEVRTAAGRALLDRETGGLDNCDPREEWVADKWAWLGGLREDIAAIEQEARREALDAALAAVEGLKSQDHFPRPIGDHPLCLDRQAVIQTLTELREGTR